MSHNVRFLCVIIGIIKEILESSDESLALFCGDDMILKYCTKCRQPFIFCPDSLCPKCKEKYNAEYNEKGLVILPSDSSTKDFSRER